MSPKVFEEGIPQGTQRFVGGEGFLFGRYENSKIPTKIPFYIIYFVEPDPGCACPIDFKCVSGDNWNLFFDQKYHTGCMNVLATFIAIQHGLRLADGRESHHLEKEDFGEMKEIFQEMVNKFIVPKTLGKIFADSFHVETNLLEPDDVMRYVFSARNALADAFTMFTDFVSHQDPCDCTEKYREVVSSEVAIRLISVAFHLSIQEGIDAFFTHSDNVESPMEEMGDCLCPKENLTRMQEKILLEAPDCFFLKVNRTEYGGTENERRNEGEIKDCEEVMFLHMEGDEAVPYIVIAGLMRAQKEDGPYKVILKAQRKWYCLTDDRDSKFEVTENIGLSEYFLLKKVPKPVVVEQRKPGNSYECENCQEEIDYYSFDSHTYYCVTLSLQTFAQPLQCIYCPRNDFPTRDFCLQHMFKEHIYPGETAVGKRLLEDHLTWAGITSQSDEMQQDQRQPQQSSPSKGTDAANASKSADQASQSNHSTGGPPTCISLDPQDPTSNSNMVTIHSSPSPPIMAASVPEEQRSQARKHEEEEVILMPGRTRSRSRKHDENL